MQRYFFQIHNELGTDEDSAGIALSSHSAAMLHAVTLCGELGYGCGFLHGFAVTVRDAHDAAIGRVSVVVASAASESRDV